LPVPPHFQFVSASPASATVTIDASIRTKADLLSTLARALHFPDTFGQNWDALVDSLSDLSFHAGTEASIDHSSLPKLPRLQLATYLVCLAQALDRLHSRAVECAGLRVTFRESDRNAIEQLFGDPAHEMTFNPPASVAALAEAERQLGVRLPDPYRDFLLRSNGGNGFVGPLGYLMLWSAEELGESNEDYEAREDAPGFVLFGSNGGGEAYAFDYEDPDLRVVWLPFIGMERDVAWSIAASFEELAAALRAWPPR
jgi:hypothetical protein